ncbi:MAG: dihydroorotate dehydrogenase-like protein [Ignavibacteriae bacterium]|nr:dihydroorotate dehydrogenase-like protein [Ignavibacteriota bacterium]
MANPSTTYLGLKLKNPIIASSSTLTSNIENIIKLEKNGVSAVVLRSIFEEEITLETNKFIEGAVKDGYDEGLFDYYDKKVKQENVNNYLKLIKDAKAAVSIPVIASVNCKSNHEWIYFAKKIEEAGADALELNMFFLPSWSKRIVEENEALYFDIIEKVLNQLSIPVTLKVSHYFSDLSTMLLKLSKTGIKGLVLFNKFFTPDFDIETEKMTQNYVYSSPQDIALPLRWISIISGMLKKEENNNCNIVASTGVHDGEGAIKQILAGADAVQIASTLYINGFEQVEKILTTLETWMEKKSYSSLENFKGKMSFSDGGNSEQYERTLFMKNCSEDK